MLARATLEAIAFQTVDCVAAMQSAGVEPMRIQANGMGASNPLAPNTTLAGQKKNRRVEITFTSPPRNTAAN